MPSKLEKGGSATAGAAKEQIAPDSSEQNELLSTYEQLRAECDFNGKNGIWFREHIHDNQVFIKVFRNLKFGFNLNTKLDAPLEAVFEAQKEVQALLAAHDALQKTPTASQIEKLAKAAARLEQAKTDFLSESDEAVDEVEGSLPAKAGFLAQPYEYVQKGVPVTSVTFEPLEALVLHSEKEVSERQQQLEEKFDAITKQLDIYKEGYVWYVQTFGGYIDFSKVFSYLRSHPEEGRFNPAISNLIHAQLELQDIVEQPAPVDVTQLDALNASVLSVRSAQAAFARDRNPEIDGQVRNEFFRLQTLADQGEALSEAAPNEDKDADELTLAALPHTIDSFVKIRRALHPYKAKVAELIASNQSRMKTQTYKKYVKRLTSFEAVLDRGFDDSFDIAQALSELNGLKALVDRLEKGIPEPAEPAEEDIHEDPEQIYAKRLEARNEWRDAKQSYEGTYKKYLEAQKEKRANETVFEKLAFWKKEVMPDELIEAQKRYTEVRRTYAQALDTALLARIRGVSQSESGTYASTEEKLEGLRAALANRFVLKAAHDKLALEKLFVPEGKSLRVFENLQKTLRKHGKLIKWGGYATVAGVALVSGGLGAAVIALGAKTVRSKISAGLVLGGATAGAYLGNRISDEIIRSREYKRDDMIAHAQYSFSPQRLDSLERAYERRYRSYEKAVQNKKYIVGGTALAGGVLGAAVAGNLHDVTSLPHDAIPTSVLPHEAITATPLPHETVPVVPPEQGPLLSHEQLQQQLEVTPSTKTPDAFVPPADIQQHTDVVQSPEVLAESNGVTANPDDYTEFDESSEMSSMEFTFEPGSKIDTVSEALYETWKQDPNVLDNVLSHKEFLTRMYDAIAQIEENPSLNHDLLEKMGVVSNDLDKVAVGQTIDLQPFFEYLKNTR